MHFSTEQVNALITGVQLSTELPPSEAGFRHFLSVAGYTPTGNHRLDRLLCADKVQNTLFWIREYEVPVLYVENDWEIPAAALMNDCYQNDIAGIQELEAALMQRVTNLSCFVSHWKTDAPL